MRAVGAVIVAMAGCTGLAGLSELSFDRSAVSRDGGMGGGMSGGMGGSSLICDPGMADCDLDEGNGCEVSILIDPLHCGICGRDCGTAPCMNGKCEPVVMAAGLGDINDVVTHAGYVYWISSNDGAVKRCPFSGCGAMPELVGTSSFFSFYLTVDDNDVFWNDNDDQQLWRCPPSGCPAGTMAWSTSVPSPTQLTGDADFLYAQSNNSNLYRVSKVTGMSSVVAGNTGSHGCILLDGAELFWSDQSNDNVARCTLAGGVCSMTRKLVADGDATDVEQCVMDATHVYFGTSETDAVVGRAERNALQPAREVLANGYNTVTGVAVDETHVYYAADQSVLRVEKAGGTEELIDPSIGATAHIALGGGFLYVAVPGAGELRRYTP